MHSSNFFFKPIFSLTLSLMICLNTNLFCLENLLYLKKRIAYIPAYSWEETESKIKFVGYLSMDINNIDKEQAPAWVSVFKASQTTKKRNAVQIQGIYNNIGWYFSLIPHFDTPQTPAKKINL